MIDYLTVIFRNYDLLAVQRKVFSSLFDPSEYRLVIVDNTPDIEKHPIDKNDNELILFRNSVNEFDGVSHGAALDYGLQYTESDIVCILDSDFFICNKDIHNYVFEKFSLGYQAVGAEYSDGNATLPVTNKSPELFENIPSCFCGYYTRELAISQSWIVDRHEVNFETSFIEVGWRIRKHILDNNIKTMHWKTRSLNNDLVFEDNGIVMGIHNVAGSHRKVTRTYDDIVNSIKGYTHDFE